MTDALTIDLALVAALDRALIWALRQQWSAADLVAHYEELRGAVEERARVEAAERAAAEDARTLARLRRAAATARPTRRALSRADARRCVEARARGVTWATLAARYDVPVESLPALVRRLNRGPARRADG